MSTMRITQPMVERTLYLIDTSGVLDILAPPPAPGKAGRRGRIRENTRLWAIGVILCTRLGQETTVEGIHSVLTEALPRQMQWELGVLRPLTTASPTLPRDYDPETARLTRTGKPRKEIWVEAGIERLGYDDLINVTRKIRENLDYGVASRPDLNSDQRLARRSLVEDAVDALIAVSVIPRTGSTVAIDATGQWAWSVGSTKGRTAAEKKLKNLQKQATGGDANAKDDSTVAASDTKAASEGGDALELAEIELDEDGNTAPPDSEERPAPAAARGRCLDAAWGYKTSKGGKKEVGFGYHQETLVRTPDPNAPADSEPLLVEGLVVVPANEDVVEVSLRLIDRARHRARHRAKITRVIGDLLYTNLKAERWAVPLAQRGIEQVLAMRADSAGLVDINGAVLQFGWMHCPSAPMDQRPMPADFARDENEEHYNAVEKFKYNWAFDRKESGPGKNPSTKWICPAMANRAGCWARGNDSVAAAQRMGLPIITPPQNHATRKCCTNKTMDFTPKPSNPHHQRKLMQREYLGDRRWRSGFNLRSLVEGAFGILKNSSRQRMRRGQNRLPGLAMANIINGLKSSVYNEEQVRIWHERTSKGPLDHPLLQPDPHDWGFTDLTKEQAAAIDAHYINADLNDKMMPRAA